MKSIYLFLLTIILGCAQTYENSILQFQNELITSEKTGSNVAMVFKDGEVVYNETVNSNKEGDKEINEETIFPIWSMSKPITIVAMMTLFEKGLINFDDNVSKYIPEFSELQCKNENGDIYSCENDLKILHLMTHRSGYTYYGNPLNFTSTIKYDNLDDFVTDVSKHPVEFEPGSSYLYGINQAILGRVVEVVTKKSFYQYLKETIFDPLDMNETKFYLTVEDRDRFQPLYINSQSLKGFTNFLDEMTYDINNKAYFGGEGLVSTMSDYSKFCIMLLNKGVYNKKKIISESSIKMMTRKYSNVNENDETKAKCTVDLDDVEVNMLEEHTNEIQINDMVKIVFRYPVLDDMKNLKNNATDIQRVFHILGKCIQEIHFGDEVYQRNDMTVKDVDEFIDQLTSEQFERLVEFFNSMPKLRHVIKITNPKTKVESEVVLEGLESFLG